MDFNNQTPSEGRLNCLEESKFSIIRMVSSTDTSRFGKISTGLDNKRPKV